MSFEINKFIGAILTSLLIFFLTSFITEFIYPHNKLEKSLQKVSYIADFNSSKSEEEKDILVDETILNDKELKESDILKLLNEADSLAGKKFASKNCSVCHSLDDPNKNKIGPSLVGIFERDIATSKNFRYSKAFLALTGKWSEFSMFNFLSNPMKWAVGTKMSYTGIKDVNQRANVILYLKKLSSEN